MTKRIMIVDDNSISVEGIKKNIDWQSLNAKVCACRYDGLSALETLSSQKIDLIISDIEMPGLSGLELSLKALAKNPFIKIILISAYDNLNMQSRHSELVHMIMLKNPLTIPILLKK